MTDETLLYYRSQVAELRREATRIHRSKDGHTPANREEQARLFGKADGMVEVLNAYERERA